MPNIGTSHIYMEMIGVKWLDFNCRNRPGEHHCGANHHTMRIAWQRPMVIDDELLAEIGEVSKPLHWNRNDRLSNGSEIPKI